MSLLPEEKAALHGSQKLPGEKEVFCISGNVDSAGGKEIREKDSHVINTDPSVNILIFCE